MEIGLSPLRTERSARSAACSHSTPVARQQYTNLKSRGGRSLNSRALFASSGRRAPEGRSHARRLQLPRSPVRVRTPYVRGGLFIQLLPAGFSSCVRLRSPSAMLRMRERSQQHRSKRGV
ncbi:hypothetical protein NDU88_008249 [Pleurodeles waltl]|uniref:Uncharacterized protein n=1 Tax=Pleurodeles waltl TaxID=8319 RepID=A0AAV7SV45_PLEWA|nr:hypothetical protein NDU88_008249 [Pleurodeles waltl]